MNTLKNFNDVIDYIEEHLTEDIDIDALAKKAQLSIYEFRRIFSFVAQLPVSEYIRKRRLSCAYFDLKKNKVSVTETATKYCYDNVSSFSRAFKEFHGFAPNEVSKEEKTAKMFTKISFSVVISGGKNISYRIVNDGEFFINGICEYSDITDSECCENAWDKYYSKKEKNIDSKQIYACYENSENSVKCVIGVREEEKREKYDFIRIPSSKWAVFELRGTEDKFVNEFYRNVLFSWFNASGYERNETLPNIEVFPQDMSADDFLWEIRIPVCDRRTEK